ncbi:MAG: hypothetical protein F6K37_04270 [Moorea sp. SIO4E2]|uniref:hypothetical protein n=1 Tax=Moorena sp. SIO4E2 TaxID=2607826 RepID=UPI0013BD479F|nr:hypothetical protein [Moorena sp. SIO4E2]NEQ05218.1 hypothetical protein [Moorena sp. SIO4E2]
MFQLLYVLIYALQPDLDLICFCLAWGITMILVWTVLSAVRESFAVAKRLHQIPCSNCQFFTGDYRLKCTVHPSVANSEAAINCIDFCAKNNYMTRV